MLMTILTKTYQNERPYHNTEIRLQVIKDCLLGL